MTSAIADLAVAQAAATEKASALEGRIASLETSRLWLIGAVAAAIIKALLALIIPT
ncbi:MAG: hypothetical protein LBB54_04570 [Cellulomonadaceae bacterium]|nr:hypothetical protein [Cellulomonadaceae bacterium]